jgi:hypothetical protein
LVEAAMSRLTAFLAKLIGSFMVIVGVAIGLHKQASVESIEAIAQTPVLLLVMGLITLAVGLALVFRHNAWSGGVVVIAITLVGWIILLRAVLLLFVSPQTVASLLVAIRIEGFFYGYVGAAIVIGCCLAYAGFASQALIVESAEQ